MKTIPGFPAYCATKDGRIWSRKTRRFLKPSLSGGYCFVNLYKNSKVHEKYIHRLILETFIGSCPKGMECCHGNGVKSDNKLKNLRWDTKKNNTKDAIKHGTHCFPRLKGEINSKAKLKEKDVRMIIYIHRTGLFLQREIAKIYNISRSTIGSIVNRKTWKHLWSDSKIKLI